MTSLSELPIRKSYHKPEDDIAHEFYLPVVAASTGYDRAVGFFSSSIYLLAWKSLKQFVDNGGKMRMICSPVLSEEDSEALYSGYSARAENAAADAIIRDFDQMMLSGTMMKPAVVLASLVQMGVVDCKLAWIGTEAGGRPRRLFHDKVGILSDGENHVVFKGSMNETWPGLSLDGNLESVDVYVSWRDAGEQERIDEEVEYFERLWRNDWPGVSVVPFPDNARHHIISASEVSKWSSYVDEINLEMEEAAGWSPVASKPGGRLPRSHQLQALEAWTAVGRRGILEHATGSGKTFTALCAINDGIRRGEIPLVLVPSELLLVQWEEELRLTFDRSGLQLLVCGGGHADWHVQARLRGWTRKPSSKEPPRAVLATLQTASSDRFIGLCSQGSHLLLVADEVHRLGAAGTRRIMAMTTGARLGLSATPRRAGDPDGTQAVLDYFERIIQPPFGVQEAIKSGALTPYAYRVYPVHLKDSEQAEWQKLTDQFRRLYAKTEAGGDSARSLNASRLKNLLIQRARIVKTAAGKIDIAARVLRTHYQMGQRWIVYCDNQVQVQQVKTAILNTGLEDVYEYHSAMNGDRQSTLAQFNALGGIVVSIRCLDEGVDIPAVSHALILASSRNPREFIQRRGRVLRRAPGKALAFIHDVIVAPHAIDAGDGGSILLGEIARAIEFGSHAINPASVTDLKILAAKIGLDWAEANHGIEVDDEDQDGDFESEVTHVGR